MLTIASRAIMVTMVVLMVISGLSVVLRLHLRRQRRISLNADDYFIITAWVFSAALSITNFVGVFVGGFGEPFSSLSDDEAVIFLKIFFVLQFWYITAVALVKFSILFLYGRVFGIGRFPISVLILFGISVGWFISFLFAAFFQVWPLWCNWIACVPTTDYAAMYVLLSVTDIAIDIGILALPVFFIRKLHLSRNQKIGICGIFGLGIFCVVSSVARLVYTIQFQMTYIEGNYEVNFSDAVVNIIMWSGIEACASTLCANLPCYGPLVTLAHNFVLITPTISTFFSSSSRTARNSRRASSRGAFVLNPTVSRENILGLEMHVENVIQGGAVGAAVPREEETSVELGRIRVDNSFNIYSV